MARSRGGSPRPAGNGAGRTRSPGLAGEPVITVRCPNEECGMVYTVPARYAGRRAECSHCGTRAVIPKPARPAPARRGRRAPNGRARSAGYEVRVGCIGRGHAGKTALFQVLGDSLVGEFLPSGLHLDAADPREVARMIREAEEAHKLLRQSGLPPTLAVSHNRYCVYEGDKRRVVCKMREVIGQVLTHTLPDSEPELQARYVDYLKDLVNAHVLWVVVPCPPADPQQRDRRRYANDLRITMAYLREALRLRTRPEPAAVALVLSKTDALFDTPGQARAALTDDVLRQALGPLVQLIDQSKHVSDAAIIPVTAFGFGKAVQHPHAEERHGAPGSAEEPFGDEPIWLLREGESPAPYNVDALFLWSLLLGLLNQAGPEGPAAKPKLDKVSRMLRDDLEAGSPWLVPIKGGVSLAPA
jgi:hypothetical protein